MGLKMLKTITSTGRDKMNRHPIIRMSKKEALAYAGTCELYAREDEPTFLEVNDKGDLFMKCEKGSFTIWHGYMAKVDVIYSQEKHGLLEGRER